MISLSSPAHAKWRTPQLISQMAAEFAQEKVEPLYPQHWAFDLDHPLKSPSMIRRPPSHPLSCVAWWLTCISRPSAIPTMLRLTVTVASIACCSSFLTPPLALRSPSHISANGVQQLHMMTHHEDDLVGDSAPTYSGQVDRRTLLKAIPATLVAGKTLGGAMH